MSKTIPLSRGHVATAGEGRDAEKVVSAKRRIDENALRLSVLREFLDRGLSLSDAVKVTNDYFKQFARKA